VKVKISIEFDVNSDEDDFTEAEAKAAASVAAWDNLVLTANGQNVCETVTAHVDGFGECTVSVGDEHE